MSQSAHGSPLQIGFLRVARTGAGFVGGLLVTNHLGRPLEFQCTTPVRPTRTQEILYGNTLEPFLYAELIGKTLFDRLGIKPRLIVVHQQELLDLRRHIELPVVCLRDGTRDMDQVPRLGRHGLSILPEFSGDVGIVESLQSRIPADADLGEPLERVHEALQEALKSHSAA